MAGVSRLKACGGHKPTVPGVVFPEGMLESMVSVSAAVTAAMDQYLQKQQQQQHRTARQHTQKSSSMKKGFLSAKPKQPQQQKQQGEASQRCNNPAYVHQLAHLADDLTFAHLALNHWPGKLLSGKTYAQTVLPIAKLAAAVLRFRKAFSTKGNTAVAGSSDMSSSWT